MRQIFFPSRNGGLLGRQESPFLPLSMQLLTRCNESRPYASMRGGGERHHDTQSFTAHHLQFGNPTAIVCLIDRTIAFLYCLYPSSEDGHFKCHKSLYMVGTNKTVVIGMRLYFYLLTGVAVLPSSSPIPTSTIAQSHIIITKTPFHMPPKYLYTHHAPSRCKKERQKKRIMKIIIQG